MIKFFYILILGVWVGTITSFAQSSQTQTTSVYFEYNKAELRDNARQAIDKMFAAVYQQKIASYEVTLTGVADSVGTTTGNYDLAKNRALVVKEYLTEKGLQADRIQVKVLGERPANNEGEHHKNRRVETTLRWQTQIAKKENKPNDGNIQEFFDQVKKRSQTFTINNRRDTIIFGKEGTRMLFYANSFYAKRGQEGMPVTIQLTEYYSYNDMILANLSTTSNKKLLETGGMLYIKATLDGKEVRLKSRKNVLLSFPADNPLPDMEAFNGKRDNNGFINWQQNRRGWVLSGTPGIGCRRPHSICWLRWLFSRRLRARSRLQRGRATAADRLLLAKEIKADSLNMVRGALIRKKIQRDAYVMGINHLGWINCDAFSKMPGNQMARVTVKTSHSLNNTRYFLVLNKRRSLINGSYYT